ncbi:NHL repeat-containing protein [Aureliella helgolandensis]|uniref:NHL repeat protein n=1 Tax=Aureliella helgolandensis TaxID=2527968 RepID=A0A518GAX5_9BACT|nr:NHL repeat-containing protein [Aureliella helgolandensis]QDV25690.1 NHL repeat protein [Aureliella helgolandensis]
MPLPFPLKIPLSAAISRRGFLSNSLASLPIALTASAALSGCVGSPSANRQASAIWGRRGLTDGRLMKPRAMAISGEDEVYIVDMTGRIQVFDAEGQFQRGWRTPLIAQGKPTGMSFAPDGTLLVADTHYFRMLAYSPSGQLDLSRTIGQEHGDGPGQFHFVTDVVQNADNHYFIGQYGQIDRIQEFDPAGEFVRTWGSQGSRPGEFSRPQCLVLDDQGLLWIADACNHRVQVFDVSGSPPELVACWGQPGNRPGQLQYPYELAFDSDGSLLIAEYGNHRIQRFSRSGESLEVWGSPGSGSGQLLSPWGLGLNSQHQLFVLDSLNHRVQRFDLG